MKSLNVNDIEPELHKRLKLAATKIDQTIRDFVLDAIENKIKEVEENENQNTIRSTAP